MRPANSHQQNLLLNLSKTALFISLISTFSCLFLPTSRANNDTAEMRYKSARIMEASGNNIQAACTYLEILGMAGKVNDVIRKKSLIRFKNIYRTVEEKDILLMNIRNTYESVRKSGQCEEAVAIINTLLDIDKKTMYYIDLGTTYLHGFNDPDKALYYFNKALESEPNHATLYTDIGLAYESLGNDEKAAESYKKAFIEHPAESWNEYGKVRINGIKLSKEKQLIKDWLFIGPFDIAENTEGLENNYHGDISLRSVYETAAGQRFKWIRPYSRNDFGYVNLNDILQIKPFSKAYAFTYIYSPDDRAVIIKTGSDDGITIWINKIIVLDKNMERSAVVDHDQVNAALKAGWNTILLKITQSWGSWGFYFRITNTNESPVADLIYDPLRDELKASRIVSAMKKHEILKTLQKTAIFTAVFVALSLLLFSIIMNARGALRLRKIRKDFISSVTHDLKIPVAAISAASEMLIDGKIKSDEKIMAYYKIISNEASRLDRYIDKILRFPVYTGGKIPISLKNASIPDLINKIVELYKSETSSAVEILVKKKNDLPEIKIDIDLFTQVLMNLLSNADKYSENNKRIEVVIKSDKTYAHIEVRDYGIGIGRKDLNNIFKKYYRSEDPSAREKRGVGLGLAFVKHAVEAHNGKVAVSSIHGKGSVFTVSFPI